MAHGRFRSQQERVLTLWLDHISYKIKIFLLRIPTSVMNNSYYTSRKQWFIFSLWKKKKGILQIVSSFWLRQILFCRNYRTDPTVTVNFQPRVFTFCKQQQDEVKSCKIPFHTFWDTILNRCKSVDQDTCVDLQTQRNLFKLGTASYCF